MSFDLDNEELRATRKLHKINDDLYEETSDKNIKNDSVIALKFAVMQQQLEEKDKRIQELEEELDKANRQLDLDYVDDNYIPKQKVKDKIELHKNYLLNQAITSNPTLDSHFRDRENYLIQTLQELLEGGK